MNNSFSAHLLSYGEFRIAYEVEYSDKNIKIVTLEITEPVASSQRSFQETINRFKERFVTWGSGISKRDPADRYDRTTGEELALARALMDAGRRLQKEALGRNKMADDNRNRVKVPCPHRPGCPHNVTHDVVGDLEQTPQGLLNQYRTVPLPEVDPELQAMLDEEEAIEQRVNKTDQAVTDILKRIFG